MNQDIEDCHRHVEDTSEKPCDIYSGKKAYAQKQCGLLMDKKGPFSECHTAVPPLEHQKTCLQDTCKCKSCYCDVLSVYAKLCMDAGVDVSGWRDQTEHCSKYD